MGIDESAYIVELKRSGSNGTGIASMQEVIPMAILHAEERRASAGT